MMDTRSSKVNPIESLIHLKAAHRIIDTLIVWTESNGTDMALSFQEAEGCAAIWFVLAYYYSSHERQWRSY